MALEEGQNIVVQKLGDLNSAVTKAKTNRIEAEAQFRGIVAAQKDPGALDAFPAILASGFIQQLKGDLAKLQRDYAQSSETLGDRHPKMVEMRTAMEKTQTTLNAETRSCRRIGSHHLSESESRRGHVVRGPRVTETRSARTESPRHRVLSAPA